VWNYTSPFAAAAPRPPQAPPPFPYIYPFVHGVVAPPPPLQPQQISGITNNITFTGNINLITLAGHSQRNTTSTTHAENITFEHLNDNANEGTEGGEEGRVEYLDDDNNNEDANEGTGGEVAAENANEGTEGESTDVELEAETGGPDAASGVAANEDVNEAPSGAAAVDEEGKSAETAIDVDAGDDDDDDDDDDDYAVPFLPNRRRPLRLSGKCPCCWERLDFQNQGRGVIEFPCRHLICLKCSDQLKKNACPTCRREG
jgi:hypothetical protein